jgi:hypothetical protein
MHILNGFHDVVRLGALRIWAERGLIHIEDSRDNSYNSIPVRAALHRIKAINDMLGNRRTAHTEDNFDEAKRKELRDFVDAMVPVIRKAQEQGMPDDHTAKNALKNRRPITVVVPGSEVAF